MTPLWAGLYGFGCTCLGIIVGNVSMFIHMSKKNGDYGKD